ncbi:MAG: amino acid racemase [Phycisphaerales bacterium]|nr:amino acid racemase [Phycisphaerales bacterium]
MASSPSIPPPTPSAPPAPPARHVGIIAVSPEASGLFYREFFRRAEAQYGDTFHAPRITLHNEPGGLNAYVAAVDNGDWQTVGLLLAESARKLTSIGADLLVVPDNLMQFGIHLAEGAGSTVPGPPGTAESTAPAPWLKMTDTVADAVTADGRTSVGIIGTRLVMEGSTYQTMLGIKGVKVIIPEPADAQMIDDIIFDELVHGIVNPNSRTKWQGAIDRLAKRGAQGVILGATEAPLLLAAADTTLPVYDSLALLADGCVKRCAPSL